MDVMTRRAVLARALVVGSSATVVGALRAPQSRAALNLIERQAARRSVDPSVIDPNFVAGRVVDRGAGTLAVLDPDHDFRQIRVVDDTWVWREGDVGGGLGVGDCIYGRGVLGDDGVLQLNKAWVSIFNISGTVVTRGANGFSIDTGWPDLGPLEFGLHPEAKMTDGRPAAQGVPTLQPGDNVRVIGFDSPGTGVATATLIAPPYQGTPSGAEAEDTRREQSARRLAGLARTSTLVNVFGVGSWQCCGGVNGCGSQCCSCSPPRCCPPPSSHGACGTCRTDQLGVAWPKVSTTGCTASCVSCCYTPDSLACGTTITVANMCPPGYSRSMPLNDCGPNPRCVTANRCQGYQVVKWDLTACAFTDLGGDLNAGFIDSEATYNK